MSDVPRPRIPVILGPTAAGKTDLSLRLAERFPRIEIVSADSRQIYTGMDIGTAKPAPHERGDVPHHFIDIVTPDVLYSAGLYADAAHTVITEILDRGGIPLVVGGSGFYVSALFQGLGAPTVDAAVLESLEQRGRAEGFNVLYEELMVIDPVAARMHSPNNHVKTLRALCCYYQTGRLYSVYLQEESIQPAPFTPVYFGIAPPRELLYERINRRALHMLEQGQGLIRETQDLLAAGYDRNAPGLRTVGYAEVLAWLAGEISEERMLELIQQSTRRYAKRQMTWFRRVEGVRWSEQGDIDAAAESLIFSA